MPVAGCICDIYYHNCQNCQFICVRCLTLGSYIYTAYLFLTKQSKFESCTLMALVVIFVTVYMSAILLAPGFLVFWCLVADSLTDAGVHGT